MAMDLWLEADLAVISSISELLQKVIQDRNQDMCYRKTDSRDFMYSHFSVFEPKLTEILTE